MSAKNATRSAKDASMCAKDASMCAKDATMSAKAATMSAKAATMSAKAATSDRNFMSACWLAIFFAFCKRRSYTSRLNVFEQTRADQTLEFQPAQSAIAMVGKRNARASSEEVEKEKRHYRVYPKMWAPIAGKVGASAAEK